MDAVGRHLRDDSVLRMLVLRERLERAGPLTAADRGYADQLNALLLRVCDAFGGEHGLRASSQVIGGELFTEGQGKMQYTDLAQILASGGISKRLRLCVGRFLP